MKVLLIGSGGREHALSVTLAKSDLLSQLYICPGNPGTAQCGINITGNPDDFHFIKKIVLDNQINMVISGPEAPLVAGMADYFESDPELSGIAFIGPGKAGAMLEGSKDFAKSFMKKYGIPTAAYETYTASTCNEAIEHIRSTKGPWVLKADGLAAGKGVIITGNKEEAVQNISEMLIGKSFGKASEKVVIEEYLEGIEVSVFVLTDGKSWILLPEAKDYKRIGEGDTGPNTGGMGAVSPVPFVNDAFMDKVKERIIIPTVQGLIHEKIPYTGFIFIGLMKVKDDPYVIEYNVRMGDPETEAVMPRLETDLLEILQAAANKNLDTIRPVFSPLTAATVVIVSGGYPGKYNKGYSICIENKIDGAEIFHSGTELNNDKLLTAGGRVLAVTSMGSSLEQALNTTYHQVNAITFEGKYFRNDIGLDLK